MSIIRRILKFIKTEVWLLQTSHYHPVLGFLIRQLRIMLIAFKGFKDHRIQLRASALTYYSLLSIVPVAAMAFGIAKGFGFDTRLESELRDMMAKREEMAAVLNYVLEFANFERIFVNIEPLAMLLMRDSLLLTQGTKPDKNSRHFFQIK